MCAVRVAAQSSTPSSDKGAAAEEQPSALPVGDVQALKARDNHTNILYLARIYLVIAATIAATVYIDQAALAAQIAWWCSIPATLLAIVVIGASQHQFGGAVHEGTHYMLFANRKLNELASDWFAAFPLFMILRQWVQHGNADRGRYTNTRVFPAGPLVRYAVFPWGMDYHLPHHMIASVPHYNLKSLHEILLRDPEYRDKGMIVEGYFGQGDAARGRPTALQVLGDQFAPKKREVAYIDNAALEHADVADPAAIAREAEASLREG